MIEDAGDAGPEPLHRPVLRDCLPAELDHALHDRGGAFERLGLGRAVGDDARLGPVLDDRVLDVRAAEIETEVTRCHDGGA